MGVAYWNWGPNEADKYLKPVVDAIEKKIPDKGIKIDLSVQNCGVYISAKGSKDEYYGALTLEYHNYPANCGIIVLTGVHSSYQLSGKGLVKKLIKCFLNLAEEMNYSMVECTTNDGVGNTKMEGLLKKHFNFKEVGSFENLRSSRICKILQLNFREE